MCDYEELPLNTLCYITGVQLNHVREQSVNKGATNLRPKRHNWAAITEKRSGQTVGEWRREGFIFGDDYADYGANRCEPWPECLKGNFLGKLGPVGNNARMGKKKR